MVRRSIRNRRSRSSTSAKASRSLARLPVSASRHPGSTTRSRDHPIRDMTQDDAIPTDSSSDAFDDLFARCIEDYESKGPSAVEAICLANPDACQ